MKDCRQSITLLCVFNKTKLHLLETEVPVGTLIIHSSCYDNAIFRLLMADGHPMTFAVEQTELGGNNFVSFLDN